MLFCSFSLLLIFLRCFINFKREREREKFWPFFMHYWFTAYQNLLELKYRTAVLSKLNNQPIKYNGLEA